MLEVKDYYAAVKKILDDTKAAQKDNIIHWAKCFGDIMENNGIIQLFGIEHDMAFSMELGYRAGGLMPYHRIYVRDLLLRGIVKEEETFAPDFYERGDLAEKLWATYNIQKEDAIFIGAISSFYPVTLDFAKLAKAKGFKIFFMSSSEALEKSESAEIGKQIKALADEFLDLGIPYPDTILPYKDGIKITQAANVAANMVVQMLTAEIYRYLKEKGSEVPVLLSANVTGADVHNKAISDKYLGRWNS
ncbi:MAG: sugar isomerase domain-containing protein [Erysipelotrichaceae bacterium]|nr:sugar isomerase domain-containing protein [Erysipelotrichaceae bacterium]